mmetsp:Transcript_10878/g.23640  ORF Transcript_10878/g.23640 Transcript_10878/m.23640 type:complete len:313 (+) Transcript_10878:369-1307(+)
MGELSMDLLALHWKMASILSSSIVRFSKTCHISNPRVHQSLFRRVPLSWIFLQQTVDEIHRVVALVLPCNALKLQFVPTRRLLDVTIRSSIEGRVARQEYVHHDTDGPNIGRLVVLAPQKFRRHVVCRSDRGGHGSLAPPIVSSRQTEVDELDGGILGIRFEQDVLRLDVAMDDVVGVQIRHGLQYRLDDARHPSLRETAVGIRVGGNLIKELAAGVLLGDDVNVIAVLVAVDHLHDAVMVHVGEEYDLALEMIESAEFEFVDGLDGEHPLRGAMDAFADGAVMSLSDDVGGDVVVVEDVGVHSRDGAYLLF